MSTSEMQVSKAIKVLEAAISSAKNGNQYGADAVVMMAAGPKIFPHLDHFLEVEKAVRNGKYRRNGRNLKNAIRELMEARDVVECGWQL